MPKLNKTDETVLENFGFEFSEVPEIQITRTSKHEARWEAAKAMCKKFPGQTLKVIEYDKKATAYQTARGINNGENKSFLEDYAEFTAVAKETEQGSDVYGIWLSYNGEG